MSNVSSKAREHFQSAQLLFQNNCYRDSVSRAYYAMYTAVEDYVGLSTTGTWNHRGIRRVFAAQLISEGVDRPTARDFGKRIFEGLNARLAADYRRQSISQDIATQTLADAQAVITWIERR